MKCIRAITRSDGKPTLYLTFDDGPNVHCTPDVLRVLEDKKVAATFFCVAAHAKANGRLLREVAIRHSVGNHSLDHKYRVFFRGRVTMLSWVSRSEQIFRRELEIEPVGFRSPAGIQTPSLHWALGALKLRLVHWAQRFFDTRFLWTPQIALRSLNKAKGGNIILLHDSHTGQRKQIFLRTLSLYIEAARARGFDFRSIPASRMPDVPEPFKITGSHSEG